MAQGGPMGGTGQGRAEPSGGPGPQREGPYPEEIRTLGAPKDLGPLGPRAIFAQPAIGQICHIADPDDL